ncbi:unnamed protein product [Amaranthus hypochondriacus]
MASMKQGQPIVQYGPYGSQVTQTYSWQVSDSDRISQVIVRHGYIVDAVGFQLTRPDGSTHNVQFGGNGGTASTISLKSGEYVTGFSGQYGYDKDRKQVGIAKIKVYTNMNPQGYGPYGLAEDVDNITNFESPLQYGWPLVGVFGAADGYLESIGVFLREDSS